MMEDEPAAIDSGFTEEFGEELEEQAGRGKPGDNATARPGDWDCHECGAYNYAFRAEQCFRCHAAKPAEPGGLPAPSGGPVAGGAGAQGANGHGGGGERRPGDWTCPSCQANVFASRLACFRCSTPRPQTLPFAMAGPGPVVDRGEVRPGDWNCPSCGVNVYSTRHQCFRCHTPKPAHAAPTAQSASGVRPGDWTCPNCQVNVYASRDKCFRCSVPKPPSAGPWCQMQPAGSGGGMPSSIASGHGASGMWLGGLGGLGAPGGMGGMGNGMGGGGMGGGGFGGFGGFGGMGGFGGAGGLPLGPPAGTSSRGQVRPGDWQCPQCMVNVYASRDKCFRCATPRIMGGGGLPAGHPMGA